MLTKTRGVVLSHTRFKESSIIVRIFTEKFGLQSYIINGIRSAKSKKGMALYQPLTLLDMVVYHKSSNKINRISEAKCLIPFTSIPFDIKKSSIAIFFTDLLTRVLKEGEENPEEFAYVFHSIEYLDAIVDNYENFHLEFMIGMSKYLGFGIFNASNAMRQTETEANGADVEHMLEALVGKSDNIEFSNQTRKKTLTFLVNYFQNHMDYAFELKSIKILNQVFS